MHSENKYQIDMCHGPLFSKIVLFSVPLMFSYVLQMFFSTADLIVVGRFASADALAAVGSSYGLTSIVLNIFFGLAVGVNVLTARHIGARDRKKVADTVHTAAAAGLYGGIIMAVIGVLGSRWALRQMSTPEKILDQATLYMQIYCAGIPFVVIYNFGSSILRAQGDTRRPLFFMVIAGFVNVLLNLFFVLVFHLDAAGVALATMMANALSAVMIIAVLTGARDASRLVWKKIRFRGDIFLDMLKNGVPPGIQAACYSASNIAIQSSVNSFGPPAIAGNTAAQSLECLVYVASTAYYHTAISFLSQNRGAQKYKRIVRSIFWCLACTFVLSLIAGFTFCLTGTTVLKIYNSDPEVIRWGMIRVKILFSTYFLNGFMDAICGALRGLGLSVKPTAVTLLGVTGFRIAWVLWVFPHDRTMENLMLSYPISWLIVSVVNGYILYQAVRDLFRQAVNQHPHQQLANLKTKI
ncbi:MAG: MATE family efflux transporter [Lentisphaerae bacterium]|nr:MATE family efflux transporter [Lentisphaerota bacterium]